MRDNEVIPAHSPLGASNCERWWNCPGSVELIAKAPPERPSIYAAEGTAAHLMASEHLTCKVKQAIIGNTVTVDGFSIRITEEMAEAVMEYVGYIRGLITKYQLLPHQYWVEHRIEIPGIDDGYGDNALFGTADTILLVPYNRLIVADYKHGAGVRVSVHGNKQLKYYGLGALHSLPVHPDLIRELSVVELIIAQPRCPGGGINSVEIPIDELYAFEEELKQAAARVQPGAPLKAGEWCKWCPAKPICPALKNEMLIELGVDFADVNVPVVIQSGLPNPATLALDELRRILAISDLVKDYLDSCRDVAFGFLEMNPELSKELGYKLVKKRSNRAYIDPEQAKQDLFGEFGHTVMNETLKSPAQLEKVLGKSEAAKFAHLWHNPDNGYTMVKNDDDRPTAVTAEIEFSDMI